MPTPAPPQVTQTTIDLAGLKNWFDLSKDKPSVSTDALFSLAMAVTIWSADLFSTLCNIMVAAWSNGSMGVPTLISGFCCGLFSKWNWWPPAQVLALMLIQFSGLFSIWKRLPKTEWPVWLKKFGRGIPQASNPLKSSHTLKGGFYGLLTVVFLSLFLSTFNTTPDFLSGVRDGRLNASVILEHVFLISGILTLGITPFLFTRGRGIFENAVHVRLVSAGLASAPGLIRLDETRRPLGPVLAEIDAQIASDLIVLTRPSGSNERFKVQPTKDLDLMSAEIVLINLTALQRQVEGTGSLKYDAGEDGIFTSETAFKCSILRSEKLYDAATSVAQATVAELNDLFVTGSNIITRLKNAQHDAIREYVYDGLKMTLGEISDEFSRLRLEVEQAGITKNGAIPSLINVPTEALESLEKTIAHIEDSEEWKEWKKVWKAVRKKALEANIEVPRLFESKVSALFNPTVQTGQAHQNVDSSAMPILTLGDFLSIKLSILKFEFHIGLPEEIDKKYKKFTDELAARAVEDKNKVEAQRTAIHQRLQEQAFSPQLAPRTVPAMIAATMARTELADSTTSLPEKSANSARELPDKKAQPPSTHKPQGFSELGDQ